MNFFATTTVVVLIATLSLSEQRTPPGLDHPCNSPSACVGPDLDPNKYIAYQPDDQFFVSCTVAFGITFNMGCQVCSERDTYFSNECQDCLSRKDVNQKNCSDAGEIKPGAGNPAENPRNCPPPNSCAGRANGTYQLSKDQPQSFFSCVGGEASECQDCPSTLVYVEVCDQCLVKDTSNPDECAAPVTGKPIKLCDASFCNNRDDGDYEKAENSNEYHACTEGSCIVKDCPPGTVFSQACGECEEEYYKNKSQCPERVLITSAPPLPCSPVDFCAGKENGNYEADSNKRQPFYHACVYGQCVVQKCASGAYHQSTDECF